MSSQLIASSSPLAGAHVIRPYPGLGVLGADVPTTGTNGASPLLNDSLIADHEYAWFVETPPASGTLTLYPDGSFDYTVSVDGAYSFTYRLYDDGVDAGLGSVTMYIGDVSAPGATLTGTSSIATGGASGTADAVAPGISLSGSSSISAGTAEGGVGAGGVTLTGIGELSPGLALGSTVLSSADLAAIDALFMSRLPDIAAAVLAAAQLTPISSNVVAGQTGIADAVWNKTLP